MEILKKINTFNFYYVFPLTLGFFAGMAVRDNQNLSLEQKLSMTVADYYEDMTEEPNQDILNELPEIKKLFKWKNKF